MQQKEIMTSPDIDPIIYNGMVYRKDDSPISICDTAISESEMDSFINNYYKLSSPLPVFKLSSATGVTLGIIPFFKSI